jgi:hypothetical protein
MYLLYYKKIMSEAEKSFPDDNFLESTFEWYNEMSEEGKDLLKKILLYSIV